MPVKRKGQSIIVINDDYAITSDSSQWKLCQPVADKNSPDGYRWQGFRYYPTMRSLVHSFVEMQIRDSEYSDLKELAANVEAIKEELSDLLEEAGIK